jgi:hypothetical protein
LEIPLRYGNDSADEEDLDLLENPEIDEGVIEDTE